MTFLWWQKEWIGAFLLIKVNNFSSQEVKAIRQWNLVNWKNITWEISFLKNDARIGVGWLVSDLLLLFKKLYIRSKQATSTLALIYFGRPLLVHIIKTNCIAFQNVDPKICSILIFHKRVCEKLPHHILCMVFAEKYF